MDLLTVETLDRPGDDDEVRALLAGLGPDRALLGGGTFLFSVPQPHLRGLVDLTAAGWTPLAADDDGLTIAATATLAQLADLDPAAYPQWPALPLLARCCESLVGSRKVWHVATVGGNVCLALPAGPMTTMAVALDGVATVWHADGGARHQLVADLVVGTRRTTLATGEVLRSIHLPAAALRGRTALRKAALSPLGRSAVLLAGRRDSHIDGGDGAFTLAVTAALDRPAVLRYPDLPEAGQLAVDLDALPASHGPWYDDPHGTPEWRHGMTRHLAEQVRTELA
jgi:CO/xanthine dehydrogenase FAD-binding subunit